ncbi:phosphotransferase [Nocardioides sp. WS12]|uniref:phosphotransferase n=1 Tax=Nocardioides sp. WS12 TaxID=2486272 RepID=UPI0015FE4420|nr:phosphotransferase [Nocardioides sp. WS12]
MSTWTSAVWGTEEFLAELCAFIGAAVGVPDRVERLADRPWSAVWRVTAGGRTSYAKQNCPGQAHEARIVQGLAQVAPEYVAPVLAADPERDLLLTGDLGPTLREQGRPTDVDQWCRLVADAAVLQRRATATADSWGLAVLAPADATTYVANAVGRLAALEAGDPRRLEPAMAARLQALLPSVERWADVVEEVDLPFTLVHNDLHPSNVVLTDGTTRFFDFGDAVLGEPLGNLLVPLDTARDELHATPDDPRLCRIADAALEVWSDVVPITALRAALPSALQLARLARVESWRRCVATMTADQRAVWGSAPAAWLTTLLEVSPVGTAPRSRVRG